MEIATSQVGCKPGSLADGPRTERAYSKVCRFVSLRGPEGLLSRGCRYRCRGLDVDIDSYIGSFRQTPKKLEHGCRMVCAAFPSFCGLGLEDHHVPTFWVLL